MHDVPLPNGTSLRLSERVHVMGIVNVTPDSFSDGGKFLDAAAAIDHGMALADEGADILDIGGESTRPGAQPVSADEEIARVVPVVEALAAKSGVPISIDTMKTEVARAALEAGAQIVNDVNAGRAAGMLEACARAGAAVILMHMRGEPRTMQAEIRYADVIAEVRTFLASRAEAALTAGISPERILLDPGFGFGKTVEHNLVLLRRLGEFRGLGYPIVAGTSRKSFIGKVLGEAPVTDRAWGTAATVALSVAHGASVVRVHEMRAARQIVGIVEAVMKTEEPR